jgi:hypothetical protein
LKRYGRSIKPQFQTLFGESSAREKLAHFPSIMVPGDEQKHGTDIRSESNHRHTSQRQPDPLRAIRHRSLFLRLKKLASTTEPWAADAAQA